MNILKNLTLQEILYVYDPFLQVFGDFFMIVDLKITTICMEMLFHFNVTNNKECNAFKLCLFIISNIIEYASKMKDHVNNRIVSL